MTRSPPAPETDGPGPLRHFIALFDAGRYWDSHEALELAWRAERNDFYHGLILYASAFVHARHGNTHGVLAQLDKARARLEPFTPAHRGIDVAAILRHADACTRLVERGGAWGEGFPWPTIPVDTTGAEGRR